MKRYGKAAGPLLELKQEFFRANEALLDRERRINVLYTQQPPRLGCKICGAKLGPEEFNKQGVGYTFCSGCGHLNGLHEDSDEFCRAVYTDDGGESYARLYSAADREAYFARVREIYRPKAAFLRDALDKNGEDTKALSFADVGAGSGYFVVAMREEGLKHTFGYEVSAAQVELGNHMAGAEVLHRHSLEETDAISGNVDADVVSLIGVLEHLRNPGKTIRALRSNPRPRYLFISVPTFSPCVFFELAFPTIMGRQLSSVHTHLYTESSLAWMAREFEMEQVAAWWFGTDMMDLFRSVAVRIAQEGAAKTLGARWTEMFVPMIDELQLSIDRRHLASEVHMLYRINR